MRLFVATDISDEIRAGLGDLQRQLQGKVNIRKTDVKWVKPELVHLTLKFLGEVNDSKAAQVCDLVAAAAEKHKSFELEAAKVGYFGKNAARVLWVGTGQSEALSRLQKDIERSLAEAGWPEEARAYSGHLTLCRIRNPKAGRKLAEVSKNYEDLQLGSWRVDSVCVYQSQLSPDGPVYTVLSRVQLGS